MNKSYRTVWNEALGAWVAASEITKARGKRSRSGAVVAAAIVIGALGTFDGAVAQSLGKGTATGTAATAISSPNGCTDPLTAGRTWGNATAANNGIAIGCGSDADGFGSSNIAIGFQAIAESHLADGTLSGNGDQIAIGSNTSATGRDSMAIGGQVTAAAEESIALGNNGNGVDIASTGSIAIGVYSGVVGSANAVALGRFASTSDSANSVVLGAGTTATGSEGSTAVGSGASVTSAIGGTALGRSASVTAANAVAVGARSKATQANAIAIGGGSSDTESAQATGAKSIAMGFGAQASGTQSISIGTGNKVTGNNSGAFGDPTIIDSANSYSVGNNNVLNAASDNVFVLGNNVQVEGTAGGSVVMGNSASVKTGGLNSLVLGSSAESSANAGIAMGLNAKVIGGTSNIAIGESALTSTTKGANDQIAIGRQAQVTAIDSIAVGGGPSSKLRLPSPLEATPAPPLSMPPRVVRLRSGMPQLSQHRAAGWR